jgi:hypothetical protein
VYFVRDRHGSSDPLPHPHCFWIVMILKDLSSTITKKLFILKELGLFLSGFFDCFWGSTKTRCLQGSSARFQTHVG